MSRRHTLRELAPSLASRAVGYVRVSTGKQEMSPAAQEEKIRQLAELQGADLVEIVEDRESAKEGSMHTRPGMLRIQELIQAGQVDRVIVAKLDRLTRSVVDLGELLTRLDRRNVTLASAMEAWMDTGSAAGRMIINIMTSVAQWEREAISERTSAVLQYKKAHGLVYSTYPPYGFKTAGRARDGKLMAGKRLVHDPDEQAVIARGKKLRAAGWTFAAIADKMNRDKVRTKGRWRAGLIERGKWYASTVRNILV